jgi:hypothetical protein
MGLIYPWENEYTQFRLTYGQIDDVMEKIHVDFFQKCRDPRHSYNVNVIIKNLIKSPDVAEKIGNKCIRVQLNDFYRNNNVDQKPTTFSIAEADDARKAVFAVRWRFSLEKAILFGLFYGPGFLGKNYSIHFE